MAESTVTVCLCGDVMLGRGVDQILAHPGDPRLEEDQVRDARDYVTSTEHAHGPIPQPVDDRWPWGDALASLVEADGPRVVNLETAVTSGGEFAPDKAVHYRMSPQNIGCLTAARLDVCALANNHVLDFGRRGLIDTRDALTAAGIAAPGAGRDADEAWRPAVVPVVPNEDGDAAVSDGLGAKRGSAPVPREASQRAGPKARRVLVLACAAATSGVPPGWAATAARAGVALLPPPWRVDVDRTVDEVLGRIAPAHRPGDIVIVSIHWGSNWGYGIDDDQVRLAHGLVDGGVDVVHGHSSHHPRPVEIYQDRLVLYGCGDFVDDYEGITGYERFRDDLRLLFVVRVDAGTGALVDARLMPLRARRLRLEHADAEDATWLADTLDRISRPYGACFDLDSTGRLALHPT
ncbi:CapA family protein [Pseudofrankia sp. DC12]|uniref:CapA family protein n=1 Tax=Pseudofrankia sp. DC12 TaxID=683315 RepID=UPI0018DDCF35